MLSWAKALMLASSLVWQSKGLAARRKKAKRPNVWHKQTRLEALHAVQKGSTWFLPAGTKVKHGTTSNNLVRILEDGLIPSHLHGRSALRATTEKAPIASNGVYVASCYAAYGSSMYNCGASFAALRKSSLAEAKTVIHLCRMALASLPVFGSQEKVFHAGYQYALDKYVVVDEALLNACGIPVVINITLQADVPIQADEDYIPASTPDEKALTELAGNIWEMYGSTALMQSVPAGWIDSIEHFDTSQKGESFAFDSYMLSNNGILDSASAFHMRNAIIQDAEKQRLGRPRFDSDLAAVIKATSLCQQKPQDSRRLWFDDIIRKSPFRGGFSGRCLVEDVPAFLDQLERDNKRVLIAVGSELMTEFSSVSRRAGIKTVS